MSIVQYHAGIKFRSDQNRCEPQAEMRRRAEPQAAHLEGFWVKMWLILQIFSGIFWFLRDFASERDNLGNGAVNITKVGV